MKKFNLIVTFILGVVLAPGLLFAASEVVIGYANISARVSPLWIAQEKGFFTKFGKTQVFQSEHLSPRMKPAVIETITRRLKVSNPALAEQGYQDLLHATDRKPYPSVEGLNNVQRLMKSRNPAVAELKAESLIDAKLIQELTAAATSTSFTPLTG